MESCFQGITEVELICSNEGERERERRKETENTIFFQFHVSGFAHYVAFLGIIEMMGKCLYLYSSKFGSTCLFHNVTFSGVLMWL